jgi:hypothetical protein
MSKCPSFLDFRCEGPSRQQWTEFFQKQIQNPPLDDKYWTAEFAQDVVDQNSGAAGAAWDEVVCALGRAIDNPQIAASKTAVEFLKIMQSVANVINADEDIDAIFGNLLPIIRSRDAWANSAASKGDPRARFWVVNQRLGDVDKRKAKGDEPQSKQAFGQQYSALVKAKFNVKVAQRTIAEDWLPKKCE